MFWFILLLLLAGAGFYFYQKMMEIEREIRAEQEAAQVPKEPTVEKKPADKPAADEPVSDSPIVTPEVEKMTTRAVPVTNEAASLEDEILAAVENLPGIKQSDMYGSFVDVNKKQLQQLIKELADTGKLKREKKGNSYLLFPA